MQIFSGFFTFGMSGEFFKSNLNQKFFNTIPDFRLFTIRFSNRSFSFSYGNQETTNLSITFESNSHRGVIFHETKIESDVTLQDAEF